MTSEGEMPVSCASNKELDNYQEINLTGDDENCFHLVKAKNVVIHTNSLPFSRGSSSNRVKTNNVVDYTWEVKYQYGHLVASTLNGNYFAYSLQLANKAGGVVRIAKHKSEQERLLIKGFKGQVKDLAFAYTQEVILACIDEYGNLEVHEINDDGVQMRTQVLLRLDRENEANTPSSYHLLFWCPFIPDDPSDILVYKNDEPNSTLLAVTHNNDVEVINVRTLSNQFGGQPILSRQLPHSLKISIKNPKDVTVATFSPDGTAFATGNLEGDISFYEMKETASEKDESPSCIHEWKPHDGKPISALYFLDNHKFHQPEVQFWKFALTGADNNQEIKLWSCETWQCLQTIRFSSSLVDSRLFQLKAELDATAGYLLLSDLHNKSVYVLQIYQNNEDSIVNVCSIAEFPMTSPILSISVVEAMKCRIKITDEIEATKKNDSDQNGEEDDEEDSSKETSVKGVSIRCFWISSKSLQDCRITYHPPIFKIMDGNISKEAVAYRDSLSEPEEEPLMIPESETLLKLANRSSSLSSDHENLLLTPNDFASPNNTSLGHSSALGKFPNANPTITPSSVPLPPITPNEEHNLNNSVTSISSLSNNGNMGQRISQRFNKEPTLCLKSDLFNMAQEDEDPLTTSEPFIQRKLSQRSSGSSPSQEVADIMEPIDTSIGELVNISSQTNGILKPMDELTNSPKNHSLVKDTAILPPKSAHQDFGSWPQAPDISKELKYISPEKPPFTTQQNLLGNETNLINVGRSNEDLSPRLSSIEQALQALTQEISVLSKTRQSQSLENQALQQQLTKYQEQTRYFQNLNHRLDKLEVTVSAHVQKAVSDQSRSNYNKVEDLMLRRDNYDRVWMEERLVEAGNCASSTVANKLDKVVKAEMNTVVLPNLSKSLESFKDSLQQDLIHRLTFSESAARENTSKLFKNKAFIESISQNVAASIQPQIQAVCRDLLYSHLVPSVEKVCQNIFTEVNETFKQGTKEYLQNIEQSVKNLTHQSLNACYQKLMEQNSRMDEKQNAMLNSIQDEIKNSISLLPSLVSDEVKNILKEHISLSPSQGLSNALDDSLLHSRILTTPVPTTIDTQALRKKVEANLVNGEFNTAFKLVLNSMDYELLMSVCDRVPPSTIFGSLPCPLKQPVVYSLIHQLLRNFSDRIDLKVNYIEEALMVVDPIDVETNVHLPNLINAVCSTITQFMKNNPTINHLLVKKLKKVLLINNSLLNTS